MGRDETLDAATAVPIGMGWTPGQHNLEGTQQMLGDFQVGGIASMMKCDQNLVRQPAGVARQTGRRGISRSFLRSDQVIHIMFNIVFHTTPRTVSFRNYTKMRAYVD